MNFTSNDLPRPVAVRLDAAGLPAPAGFPGAAPEAEDLEPPVSQQAELVASIQGPHASEFSFAPDHVQSVHAGEAAHFTVGFTASEPGLKTASLVVGQVMAPLQAPARTVLIGHAVASGPPAPPEPHAPVAAPPARPTAPEPAAHSSPPSRMAAEGQSPAESTGGRTRDHGEQIAVNNKRRAEVPALTETQRTHLMLQIVHAMGQAYSDFGDACDANKQAIKDAAKKEGDFAALLVEVGVGVLLPGIGARIGRFLNRIPVNASETLYLASMHLQNNGDNAKAHLNAIVKVGAFIGIKSQARKLFGDSAATNFVSQLRREFKKGHQSIVAGLPNMTDAQLAALRAAYDASVVGEEVYRDAVAGLVSQFQLDVAPVGDLVGGLENYQEHIYPHYIRSKTGLRLALLRVGGLAGERMEAAPDSDEFGYTFVRWVHQDFTEMAIRKARAKGGTVRTFDPSQVEGVP